MLIKVISGGQTGVDTAGLLAAVACHIPTGGYAPRGWMTEVGPRPSLRNYNLVEHTSGKYPPRTAANIKHSDATLVISPELSSGTQLTLDLCASMSKPVLLMGFPAADQVNRVVDWLSILMEHDIILNVAGNRESHSPGIQPVATAFLTKVFSAVPH